MRVDSTLNNVLRSTPTPSSTGLWSFNTLVSVSACTRNPVPLSVCSSRCSRSSQNEISSKSILSRKTTSIWRRLVSSTGDWPRPQKVCSQCWNLITMTFENWECDNEKANIRLCISMNLYILCSQRKLFKISLCHFFLPDLNWRPIKWSNLECLQFRVCMIRKFNWCRFKFSKR